MWYRADIGCKQISHLYICKLSVKAYTGVIIDPMVTMNSGKAILNAPYDISEVYGVTDIYMAVAGLGRKYGFC